MATIKELLRAEKDGRISFGDYSLGEKKKLENFEFEGDVYKVKTFSGITKLEKNGMFLYESVPGTAVEGFEISESGASFFVSGTQDAQVTLGFEAETEYVIFLQEEEVGGMETNLSGKLSLSVELEDGKQVKVKIEKK